MTISVLTLAASTLAGTALGGLVTGVVARRRSDELLAELRERFERLQRENDERVLRIKQLETQQGVLEREIDGRRRRIAELELEIGRLRMRIVDLEARRGAPAA